MKAIKLYATKKNSRRRVGLFVDLEDYETFHKYRLKCLPNGTVYFRKQGNKKFLHREILHLTQPYEQVFFKSMNNLDFRKSNLLFRVVPVHSRGSYCVHFLEN